MIEPLRILLGPVTPEESGGQYLLRALHRHQVITFSERKADIQYDFASVRFEDILNRLPSGWEPDLVLFWSPEYQGIPTGIENCPYPLVAAVGDWNMGFRGIREILTAFDHLFTDRRGVEIFQKAGYSNVDHALLFGFDPQAHYRMIGMEKIYDVSIVGNLNHDVQRERSQWLGRIAKLSERYNVRILTGLYGEEYTRVLNQSRITFNRSIRGEMNMRAYEAPACGSLLFYERENQEVHDIYTDGEHCVLYGKEDLEELVDHYLTCDEERERIIEAAYERVQNYSYEMQLERLLSRILELGLLARPEPSKRRFHTFSYFRQHRTRAEHALQAVTANALTVAERELQSALQAHPNDPIAVNNLAVTYMQSAAQTGNTEMQVTFFQQAYNLLETVLQTSKNHAIAEANRAQILRAFGHNDQAEQSFLRALGMMTSCSSELLFHCSHWPRNYDAFRVELERRTAILAHDPGQLTESLRALYRGWILKQLGTLYGELHDWNTTVYAYRQAVEAFPHADVWFLLGSALKQAGHTEAAIAAFEQTLHENPFHMEAYDQLQALYSALSLDAKAAQLSREQSFIRKSCGMKHAPPLNLQEKITMTTEPKDERRKILTFNWHEPFLCSLFKTGHQFDVIAPSVIQAQRIDGVSGWDHSKRPLPHNARLLTDRLTVEKMLSEGVYDLAICITLYDLMALQGVRIPKIFCPVSSPKNDLGPQYENKELRSAYYDTIRQLTQDVLTVYLSEQIAQESSGGYGLPGYQLSRVVAIDPDDYGGYTGEKPAVLRVGNLLKSRWFLNYELQQQVLAGLPHTLLGFNPDIPGAYHAQDWDDLRRHYRQHRVFFNSYHKDFKETPAQMSLLEAMMTGMPIVSTEHPLSIIKDGYNGFVSDDVQILRKRIQQLFEDLDLAKELGNNARQTAVEYVQFHQFLAKWEEAFNLVTGNGKQLIAPKSEVRTPISEPPTPSTEIEGLRQINWLYAPAVAWNQANWQAVLEAYVEAFSCNDDVALILNPHVSEPVSDEELHSIASALQTYLIGEGYNLEQLPDIILLDKATAETLGLPKIAGRCRAVISPDEPAPVGIEVPVISVGEWKAKSKEAA